MAHPSKGPGGGQRVIKILIDGLDGTELKVGKGETIHFGIDGKDLEIDLSAANAKALRSAFSKYIEVVRKAGGKRPAPAAASRSRD